MHWVSLTLLEDASREPSCFQLRLCNWSLCCSKAANIDDQFKAKGNSTHSKIKIRQERKKFRKKRKHDNTNNEQRMTTHTEMRQKNNILKTSPQENKERGSQTIQKRTKRERMIYIKMCENFKHWCTKHCCVRREHSTACEKFLCNTKKQKEEK